MKNAVIEIEPEKELDAFIDGEKKTRTPVRCEVKPSAFRVNIPQALLKEYTPAESAKDRIDIDRLPRNKELQKALTHGRIQFLLYASYDRLVEERIIEKRWQKERFMVNGKYIIVENAALHRQGDKKVLVMEVILRDDDP